MSSKSIPFLAPGRIGNEKRARLLPSTWTKRRQPDPGRISPHQSAQQLETGSRAGQNLGRPEQIQHLVETTTREFGKIDILVNNAATNIAQEPVLGIDEAKFDKMVEINLKSAFRLIQAIAPGMCSRGRGSIVNIASIAGVRPQYHGMLYSMTKAALIMMTQSYAMELGPSGVRVNAIAPGIVQTVLSEYYWKDETRREQILAEQPLKHLGQPEEIAELAVLLASDRGSYITGQTMVADGGRLLP